VEILLKQTKAIIGTFEMIIKHFN